MNIFAFPLAFFQFEWARTIKNVHLSEWQATPRNKYTLLYKRFLVSHTSRDDDSFAPVIWKAKQAASCIMGNKSFCVLLETSHLM